MILKVNLIGLVFVYGHYMLAKLHQDPSIRFRDIPLQKSKKIKKINENQSQET